MSDRVTCLVITGVVILEAIALLKGINGTLFSIVMALLGSLVGYRTGKTLI